MSEGNRREKAKRRKETAVRERERRGKELRMFEDYRDKSRGKKFRRNFCSINQNKMKCIAPFTTEFVERDFR